MELSSKMGFFQWDRSSKSHTKCQRAPPRRPLEPPGAHSCPVRGKYRHQATVVPEATSLLFLDDRAILAQSEQSLFDAIGCWDLFENVSRMRTNAAKTQFVARTYEALFNFRRGGDAVSTVGTILGVSVGLMPRSDSQHEKDRAAAATRCASRIGCLPVSLRCRAAIAAAVLTSKMSWGALFNGRRPNTKHFSRIFKAAVHGNLKNSRASVPLTIFLVGSKRGYSFCGLPEHVESFNIMARHAPRHKFET